MLACNVWCPMKMLLTIIPLFCVLAYAQDSLSNPSPSSGKQMFIAYCGPCHGVDGKGDGPAAPAFRRRPTDLTRLARKNHGKFPGAGVAHELSDIRDAPHGSREMPVWGSVLSELSPKSDSMPALRIANIVNYIQTLQVK